MIFDIIGIVFASCSPVLLIHVFVATSRKDAQGEF